MRQGWVVRTLSAQFLVMCGIQMVRPMVSYRALELGGSTTDLGIIAASYALLSLILAVPVGRWIDRFGEPRFIIGGAVVVGVIALWLTTIDSIFLLTVAQSILGLGQLVVAVGSQAILANAGDPRGRDARLGGMTVVGSAGQMIGPAAAGFLAGAAGGSPFSAFYAAAGGASVGLLVALTLWLRPPVVHEGMGRSKGTQEKTRKTLVKIVRLPGVPHALLASMAVLASVDLLIAYLPAYGEARGIPVATVGLLLSARAAASMVSRLSMLPLLRWMGRRRLLLLSISLPAAAVPALGLSGSEPVLFCLMLLAGFGLGLGQPMSLVWLANQVPVEMRGTTLGLRVTGNRAGQVAVPALVGIMAGAAGIWAVFVCIGLILAGSGITVASSTMDEPTGDPA